MPRPGRFVRRLKTLLGHGSLLRRFAITSFIVFVFLGFGIAYQLGRSIEQSTLGEASNSAYQTLHARLIKQLGPSDLNHPMSGSRYDAFRRFVDASVLSDRTVRVKIWSPRSTIVFSSNSRIIGDSFEKDPDLQQALRGTVASDVPDLSDPENADDRGFGPLLQVYIPIQFHHGPVLGAFEIYQRYGTVAAEISNLKRTAYLSLGGGLFLLYLLLFWIVRSGSRRIDSQQDELRRYTGELEKSYEHTIQSLAAAVDARDSSTERHSERVTKLAADLGKWMGFSSRQLGDLERGALLHDVGKIGVSDTILLKPAGLTDEEWTQMRRHPEIGYGMLKDIPFLQAALPLVLHHHERWDGRGYPTGLRGEEIPLIARLFAVIDAYDAMTSDRPYREGASHEIAMGRIREAAGTQFDPAVVAHFHAMMSAPSSGSRSKREAPAESGQMGRSAA